jgi:hypothetical protein
VTSKQSEKQFSLFRFTPHLMGCVRDVIGNCKSLTRLEISGIPFRDNVLEMLSKVLAV